MSGESDNISEFRFKRFSVISGAETFSVGTDGVLLGAWAEAPENVARIVDIGTGSGLIALMLSQKYSKAYAIGIDINAKAIETACKNAKASPFADRLKMVCGDVRQWKTESKFDLAVSNPPFFETGSIKRNTERAKARSFETLTPRQLIESAGRLLVEGGRFEIIIPFNLTENFEYIAWENDFHLARRTRVVTVRGKCAKRIMLDFIKGIKPKHSVVNNELTLYDANGEKTDDYKRLTNNFYLDNIS